MEGFISKLISKIFDSDYHEHEFVTTHTNKWLHNTRQQCSCGVSREFVYFDNADEINGMPWHKGRWVHSDGEESEYCAKTRHDL